MLQAIERAGAVDREKVAAELHKPGATWKRAGRRVQVHQGGLSQIVSYTHQMQKGEPVVVWPTGAGDRQDDLAFAFVALNQAGDRVSGPRVAIDRRSARRSRSRSSRRPSRA